MYLTVSSFKFCSFFRTWLRARTGTSSTSSTVGCTAWRAGSLCSPPRAVVTQCEFLVSSPSSFSSILYWFDYLRCVVSLPNPNCSRGSQVTTPLWMKRVYHWSSSFRNTVDLRIDGMLSTAAGSGRSIREAKNAAISTLCSYLCQLGFNRLEWNKDTDTLYNASFFYLQFVCRSFWWWSL